MKTHPSHRPVGDDSGNTYCKRCGHWNARLAQPCIPADESPPVGLLLVACALAGALFMFAALSTLTFFGVI